MKSYEASKTATSQARKENKADVQQANKNKLQSEQTTQNFIQAATEHGFTILGTEVYFDSVFTKGRSRRYDVILQNPKTGYTVGIELKSSTEAFNRNDPFARAQQAADTYYNQGGGWSKDGKIRIEGTLKILWN